MENLSKTSSDDFTTKPVLLTVGAFHGISSILSPKSEKSEKKSKKIDLFFFIFQAPDFWPPILTSNSGLQLSCFARRSPSFDLPSETSK